MQSITITIFNPLKTGTLANIEDQHEMPHLPMCDKYKNLKCGSNLHLRAL